LRCGKIKLGLGCCPNPQNSFPDKGLLELRKVDQYSSREDKAGNRDPAIIDCRQWEEMNMPRMMAIEAAVHVLEKEGVTVSFGVPGAAINPLYSAMNRHGGIRHILARHVEGASHMADGYTRAMPGNIGVCIGTSGPA
jgi:hypothetical protein